MSERVGAVLDAYGLGSFLQSPYGYSGTWQAVTNASGIVPSNIGPYLALYQRVA